MNAPRKLTSKELDEIIEVIPKVMAATKECGEFIRAQIQKNIKEQLRIISITPLGINDLKKEIERQFTASVADPGSCLGILASESLSSPLTQMSLSSFHSTGSFSMNAIGVEGIKEIFNTSKERKVENNTVHFKNKDLYFDEVIKLRSELVGVTVKDLLSVMNKQEIVEFDDVHPRDVPFWEENYLKLSGKFKPEGTSFVRLYFDINKLYSYKILLQDVVHLLEGNKPQSVKCYPSPTYLGIIDVYPIIDQLELYLGELNKGLDPRISSIIFLKSIFLENLDKETVKGIPNIKYIFPQEVNVLASIKNEEPGVLPGEWILNLDQIEIKKYGIPEEKIVRYLNYINIKVIKYDKESIIVSSPYPEKPSETSNKLLAEEKKKLEESEDLQRKEGKKFIKREISQITRLGMYYYAVLMGRNLRKLLLNKLVDKNRSYSNNLHDMLEVFGIETARNMIIKQTLEALPDDSSTNPRHIFLMADFMTNQGVLIPITSRGVSRQNVGVLSKASFENSMEAFSNGALSGAIEETVSTSTSIFLGSRAKIGTGFFELELDETKLPLVDQSTVSFQPEVSKKDLLLNAVYEGQLTEETPTVIETIAEEDKKIFNPSAEDYAEKQAVPEVVVSSLRLPPFLSGVLDKPIRKHNLDDFTSKRLEPPKSLVKLDLKPLSMPKPLTPLVQPKSLKLNPVIPKEGGWEDF